MTKTVISLLCVGTVSLSASAQPYEDTNKLPQINTPAIEFFKEGIEYFTDQGQSRFIATQCRKQVCRLNNSFATQQKDFTNSFGHSYRVVNSKLIPMQEPHRLKVHSHDQVDLTYPNNQARLLLKLKAIDISGQKIVNYLKDINNESSLLSSKVNPWEKFPNGSVALAPTMRLNQHELLIPNADVMTAQKTLDKFIETYSGHIPSCLRYERRPGAQPYAIRFQKKTSKSGQIIIYKADRTNIMCETVGEPVAKGSYQRKRINGTNVMTFNFPASIDSRDIGIKQGHQNAMEFALIEVSSPKKEVLPGRIIYANRDFYDYQYRFNKTAANAIDKALR